MGGNQTPQKLLKALSCGGAGVGCLREVGSCEEEVVAALVAGGCVPKIAQLLKHREAALDALQNISQDGDGVEAIRILPAAITFAVDRLKDSIESPALRQHAINLVGNLAAGCPKTAHSLAISGVLGSLTEIISNDAEVAETRHVVWALVTFVTAAPQLGHVVGRLLGTPEAAFALAVAALPEEEGDDDTDVSGNFLDMLVNEGYVDPGVFLRCPEGQGVGVLLQILEDGPASAVHAAKVCLLAICSEEEGVAGLANHPADSSTATALLALAPHSRRMAGYLRSSLPHRAILDKDHTEEVQDLCSLVQPAKRVKGSFHDALSKALAHLETTEPRDSPSWGDICGDAVLLRTEASYALYSSRKGVVVFSKPSAAGFGPVTVTRHGTWHCLRFGEVEQGLTYSGSPGELGYAGGKAIVGVLGYDYIRTMAACLCAYGGAGGDKVVINVGLGSGALPAFASNVLGCAVSVLEIDSVVIEAADIMGITFDTNLSVTEIDALSGISKMKPQSAGAVLLDAYDTVGGIPGHLRDVKFLEQVGRVLCPNGVAIANLHNGPMGSRDRGLAKEYIELLRKYVGVTYIVKLPTQQSNLVAIAFRADHLPLASATRITPVQSMEFDVDSLVSHIFCHGDNPAADGLPLGLWGENVEQKVEEEEEGEEEEEEEEEKVVVVEKETKKKAKGKRKRD